MAIRDGQDVQKIRQLLQQLGFSDDWQDPEYPEEMRLQRHVASMDLTQENTVSMLAYQTNVGANATRSRPQAFWLGYLLEPKCMFHTLDNPAKKRVFNSSAHGNGVFSYLYMASEFANGRGFEPGTPAFEGLNTTQAANGITALADALGWLEGTVTSQADAGDHLVYVVEITAASRGADLETEKPWVHIRKNGFGY